MTRTEVVIITIKLKTQRLEKTAYTAKDTSRHVKGHES